MHKHESRTQGMRGIGMLLILVIVLLSSPSQVFAEATVEPYYTHCCLPKGMAHNPIPTSISGTVDGYEIAVTNSRNVSMTSLMIYIPADFELIKTSVAESGWITKILPSQTGASSIVIWNGSSILPGMTTIFMLTLHNPDVGLHLSAVYTFLMVEAYDNGAFAAVRDPVEIIQPIRLFGIDSPTLAFALVAIVFGLLVVDAVLPARKPSTDLV